MKHHSAVGGEALPGSMTLKEAEAITGKIRHSVDDLWALLLEAHERKAWSALGYKSWEAYVAAEFDMSRRRSYQLIDQGLVIRAIEDAAGGSVNLGTQIGERAAREIKSDLPAVAAEIRAKVEQGADPTSAAAAVINAKRDDRARDKAARTAEQAEHDRQRRDMVSQLPASIVEIERAKAERLAAPPIVEPPDADDLDELRNVVAAQKDEIEDLQRKVAKFDDMVVEFERGGFENVITGLEQRIEVLRRQVERESQEKVKNLRAAEYWKKKALEAGANDDVVIDMATGEMSRG